MAQINLCYEALTRRRKEYDASKGRESPREGQRSEANGAREAWWRSQGGFEDFQESRERSEIIAYSLYRAVYT